MSTLLEIEPKDAFEKLNQEVVFVDVREIHELEEIAYNVPNIIHAPLSDFENHLKNIPQDKTIIMACRSGGRSQRAGNYLINNNFEKVYNLTGGILKWHEEGFPTI